jgi:hypothetical protein
VFVDNCVYLEPNYLYRLNPRTIISRDLYVNIALHIFGNKIDYIAFYMPICHIFRSFCILLYTKILTIATMNTQITLQNPKYQTCIDACCVCCEACETCCTSCLSNQKVGTMTRCIMMARDCANMCSTAICLMSRGSEYAKQICNICAEVCDACAVECEKFSSIEECKQCADACRKCAQECRNMTR